jgi:IMP dehydrogenase
MKLGLTFDDVLIIPQYSEVEHRGDVDVSTKLGKHINLKVPIISANMDTVTGPLMAIAMDKVGGLGILHRFCSIKQAVEDVLQVKIAGVKTIAASVGIGEDRFDRLQALVHMGVKVICIDVAHGHHSRVIEFIKRIRNIYGDDIDLIAGNVATELGARSLALVGINTVKIGIGPSGVCSTRVVSGCGVPQFTAIQDSSKPHGDVTFIADGGCRSSGDIVKALAAGAHAVMLGGLLAGCDEAPGAGDTEEKVYRGSASRALQEDFKGQVSGVEGIATFVQRTGSVESVITSLVKGIQSGCSYVGAHNLDQLRYRAQFIQVTPAGITEGQPYRQLY